ncbi:hypothetical protein HAX54_005939, partial [Datura stramonium]|nr:hypothetical protein [Datura stramonium]
IESAIKSWHIKKRLVPYLQALLAPRSMPIMGASPVLYRQKWRIIQKILLASQFKPSVWKDKGAALFYNVASGIDTLRRTAQYAQSNSAFCEPVFSLLAYACLNEV